MHVFADGHSRASSTYARSSSRRRCRRARFWLLGWLLRCWCCGLGGCRLPSVGLGHLQYALPIDRHRDMLPCPHARLPVLFHPAVCRRAFCGRRIAQLQHKRLCTRRELLQLLGDSAHRQSYRIPALRPYGTDSQIAPGSDSLSDELMCESTQSRPGLVAIHRQRPKRVSLIGFRG